MSMVSDPLSTVNATVGIADSARNRTLDLLVIAAVAGIIWLWWKAHTHDQPVALVPNENVADIAPTVPETVYTYNMPFYGAKRKRIATPNMPSGTRVPLNPSGQPSFNPCDSNAEAPLGNDEDLG